MNSENIVTQNSTDKLTKLKIADFAIDAKGINRNTVEELKRSIKQVGLLNPAVITQKGTLVAGRHRIVAMKELGYATMVARVIGFGQKEKRQLATIQENLARNVYTRHERARLIGNQEDLLVTLGLASEHGGDRKTKVRNSQLESAVKQIKRMTGQSERTTSEDLQIHKGIPNELDLIISSSAISNDRDALLKIAKAKDCDKENVAKDLISKTSRRQKSKEKKTHGEVTEAFAPMELIIQAHTALKLVISKLKSCNGSSKLKKAHQLLEVAKEIETKLDVVKTQISEIKEKLEG